MENKTYIDNSFETEKEKVLNFYKSEVEDIQEEIKCREKVLWKIFSKKVLKHAKLGDIKRDYGAKTIHYNGTWATTWEFTDQNTSYTFRKERVSSSGGYTRFRLTIRGSYPSETEKNTVIGFEEVYSADDRTTEYNTHAENTLISLISALDTFSSNTYGKIYETESLEKLNKIIDAIE